MKSQLIKRLKYVETGKNDTQRTKTSCTNPIKLATGGNEKIVAKCTSLGLLQCPRDDGRRGVCSVRRVHIFLAPRYSQPDTLQNNLVNCIQTASFITRFVSRARAGHPRPQTHLWSAEMAHHRTPLTRTHLWTVETSHHQSHNQHTISAKCSS